MTLSEFKDRSEFGKYLTAAGYTGTGVEVGVFKGEFSNQILSSWHGNLIGVDCYNNGTEFYIMWEAIRKNQEYIMDCRYQILVCQSCVGHKYIQSDLDFVYIDAGHTYPEVSLDISMWFPKIRKGGILCGHDYDPREGGVMAAVDEFMSAHQDHVMHRKTCGSWFMEKI